jgi:hypothetical protein
MPKAKNRRSRAPKAPKRDVAGPAYKRLERIAMRPDDSLFAAAVIGGAGLVAWLVTMWR